MYLERKALSSPSISQKRNKTDNSGFVTSALQQLADIRKTVNERVIRDECSIFGELVTARLRKLEEGKKQVAMHRIQTILFELSTQSSSSNVAQYASTSQYLTQTTKNSCSPYEYQAPCHFPTSPDLFRSSTPQSLNSEQTFSQSQW